VLVSRADAEPTALVSKRSLADSVLETLRGLWRPRAK
jgi:hypothetical protein